MLRLGEALARQAARSDRAWLDLLVLLHQGKRTREKAPTGARLKGQRQKKKDASKQKQGIKNVKGNSDNISHYLSIATTEQRLQL